MKNMNIKLVIAYDGSNYLGWQRLGGENKFRSIQGYIEEVLQEILSEKIKIVGSGRTDAGVHAMGQVANFYLPSSFLSEKSFPGCDKVLEKGNLTENWCRWFRDCCNRKLPEDIRIKDVEQVEMEFHSRFSAISKTYIYRLDTRTVPQVFARKYALWVGETLDIGAMKECADLFLGEHDFRGFSSVKDEEKNTLRTIEDISFSMEDSILTISIKGNGFLYNMVRILVGTMIEIGQGKRTISQVKDALECSKRQMAGITVSSVGLCLKQVEYPSTKEIQVNMLL